MHEGEELRIVLLGKTGVGKSAVCNRILGENVFEAKCSPESVTQICKRKKKVINGRNIVLIDTPGIFDTNRSEEELKYEIISCLVECAPGPHVFILVLQVHRHTEENQKALEKLLEYFSGDSVHHMVLLFTRGDDLEQNMTIQAFINKSDAAGKKHGRQTLKDLAERFGSRVHVIDNKHWNENSRYSDVLASLQALNLSEQATREITEKMSQTPADQTPWFNVLSDNEGNAEAGGNEEQRLNRNNRYQLTKLMKSVKEILTRFNSGHYSNETLEEIGKAINAEVENIQLERDIRNPAETENEREDMVEIRRSAIERVRRKSLKYLAGVKVKQLLDALLGVGVGLAAPFVFVADLIRAAWRKATHQRPQAGDPPAQTAGLTSAVGFSAGTELGELSRTSDNPTQAADKVFNSVKQKAGDVLNTHWNLGNTDPGDDETEKLIKKKK